MFYLVLLTVGVTAAAGDLLVYRWAKSQTNWSMVAALLSWSVSLVLFGLLLRWGARSLGVTFVLVAVTQAAIILAWDAFAVGSRWSRLEVAGIILAVAGVILIELGQHSSETSVPEAEPDGASSRGDF